METPELSREVVLGLFEELQDAFKDTQSGFSEFIESLKKTQEFLNFKFPSQLHTSHGQKQLEQLKEIFKNYLFDLERLKAAYFQLSYDLKQITQTYAEPEKNALETELHQNAQTLAQHIQTFENRAGIFRELLEVLFRISHQRKATPLDQKEIENWVFELQLLKG